MRNNVCRWGISMLLIGFSQFALAWGVMTTDPAGNWGYAGNMKGKKPALEKSLHDCMQNSEDRSCQFLFDIPEKGFIAFAFSRSGRAFGLSTKDQESARKKALQACEEYSTEGDTCLIVFEDEERVGGGKFDDRSIKREKEKLQ